MFNVGDPMPRIRLKQAGGGIFDSFDPFGAGQARAYWIGPPPEGAEAQALSDHLTACETVLHFVTRTASNGAGSLSRLIDEAGDLARAVGGLEPLALVIDAAGRVAAILLHPAPEQVVAVARRLHAASSASIVRSVAPVMLLERVADERLCRMLIEHWRARDKIVNSIDATGGNVVRADIKRRQDVQVDDPALLGQLRDTLMNRVAPMILRASSSAYVALASQACVATLNLPRYLVFSAAWASVLFPPRRV